MLFSSFSSYLAAQTTTETNVNYVKAQKTLYIYIFRRFFFSIYSFPLHNFYNVRCVAEDVFEFHMNIN